MPGFGLVRAGQTTRGVLWFIALQVIGSAAALLLIWRSVSIWFAVGALGVGLVCAVIMLKDSFRPGRMTFRLFIFFFLAAGALLVLPSIPQLFVRGFKVPTAAMQPTLQGASTGVPDQVFVDRISYRFSEPRRGDLVVFRTAGIDGIDAGAFFVKRLVGLPGERIEIGDGRVLANGRALSERDGIPALNYTAPRGLPKLNLDDSYSYAVASDGYFVLGDNSAHSYDSRYWGSVPRENIDGRVARIYYPFSRLGTPE